LSYPQVLHGNDNDEGYNKKHNIFYYFKFLDYL